MRFSSKEEPIEVYKIVFNIIEIIGAIYINYFLFLFLYDFLTIWYSVTIK